MKKFTMFGVLFLSFTLCLSSVAFAHPGRTDAFGGHYDRKTGLYHFHNSGTASLPKTTTPSATTPTLPQTTTSTPKATTSTPKAATSSVPESTTSATEVTNVTVDVDGIALAGPILLYKNMYYIPIDQLLPLMGSKITRTFYPVSFSISTLPSTNQELKSQIMDDLIVYVPMTKNDMCYHRLECPRLTEGGGLDYYYATDIRMFEYETLDWATPCPYCMFQQKYH